MLKGVNRQIVEVNEPDNKYFERILYVVRPEASGVSEKKLAKAAAEFTAEPLTPPQTEKKRKKTVILTAAGVILSAVIIVAAVIIFL